MNLIISSLWEDSGDICGIETLVCMTDKKITQISEDELAETETYKALYNFERYLSGLRFNVSEKDEAYEDSFFLSLETLDLDVLVLENLLEMVFSTNPKFLDIPEKAKECLFKLIPELEDQFDVFYDSTESYNPIFKCSIAEDEALENDSHVVVLYSVEIGGRGPDNDIILFRPTVLPNNPETEEFLDFFSEEVHQTDWQDFKEEHGIIPGLEEFFNESNYGDYFYVHEYQK